MLSVRTSRLPQRSARSLPVPASKRVRCFAAAAQSEAPSSLDFSNQLEALKSMSTVVADTAEVGAIKEWGPQDCTTNPS